MKRTLLMGLLSATVLVSTAAPSLSDALNSNPTANGRSIVRVMAQGDGVEPQSDGASAPALVAQADFDRDGRDDVGPLDEIAPPDIGYGPSKPELRLAMRLAVAESYVAITSSQLDAWRVYAVALIELVGHPKSNRGPEGARRERPNATREERPDGQRDDGPQPEAAPLFTERLADRAIERGEKARTLKAAAVALRSVLALDQIAKLRDVECTFLPPPGPLGPGEPGDDHVSRHNGWHADVPPLPPLLGE